MMSEPHPFEERQSSQEYFRTLMHTVVGQAFEAAGYQLRHEPLRWMGGRFRYIREQDGDRPTTIEFQVLVYNDTAYTGRQPSRFAVNLYRGHEDDGRSLSRLVVSDFGVAILPAPDHWWQFHDTESLGKALAEAGHLIVGYGIPWLAGDLEPGVD